MLMHPTIDLLRELKLDGMAQAFVELEAQDNARDLSHAEWLALLLDRETASRNNKRFETRLKTARLRHGEPSCARGSRARAGSSGCRRPSRPRDRVSTRRSARESQGCHCRWRCLLR